MNNLYGQTQVLGKATSTTQSIDNGLFNYVLPYNQNDFFAYSDITFEDASYCQLFKLDDADTNQAADSICDANPNNSNLKIYDDKNEEITLKQGYCYTRELCKNKEYADKIMLMDKNHAANDGQYLDIVTHTNLETLNITNLFIGTVVMLVIAFRYT